MQQIVECCTNFLPHKILDSFASLVANDCHIWLGRPNLLVLSGIAPQRIVCFPMLQFSTRKIDYTTIGKYGTAKLREFDH